jgi:hypothetical protein
MAADTVVFLGPSLPVEEARTILDADYRPPAGLGDVVRAVLDGPPRTIALIDGVFARMPAVRHKEILFALCAGVRVAGAASMGALRAAELEACGMEGVGFCFRWYRATPLADDDEVAVAMAPPELGSAPLSDALIDIRLTLKRARREGVIGEAARRALEDTARNLPFVERSYDTLVEAVGRDPAHAADVIRLAQWLPAGATSRKRADALALLQRLATTVNREPAVPRCAFHLTEVWAADLDAVGLWDEVHGRGLSLIRYP